MIGCSPTFDLANRIDDLDVAKRVVRYHFQPSQFWFSPLSRSLTLSYHLSSGFGRIVAHLAYPPPLASFVHFLADQHADLTLEDDLAGQEPRPHRPRPAPGEERPEADRHVRRDSAQIPPELRRALGRAAVLHEEARVGQRGRGQGHGGNLKLRPGEERDAGVERICCLAMLRSVIKVYARLGMSEKLLHKSTSILRLYTYIIFLPL